MSTAPAPALYAAFIDATSKHFTGSPPDHNKASFFARESVPITVQTDAQDAFGELSHCPQFQLLTNALQSAGIHTLPDLVDWKGDEDALADVVILDLEENETGLTRSAIVVLRRSIRKFLAAAWELPSTPGEATAPVEPVESESLVPDGNDGNDGNDDDEDGDAANELTDAFQILSNDEIFEAVKADNKLLSVLARSEIEAALKDGFSRADVSAITQANIDQYNEYQHDMKWQNVDAGNQRAVSRYQTDMDQVVEIIRGQQRDDAPDLGLQAVVKEAGRKRSAETARMLKSPSRKRNSAYAVSPGARGGLQTQAYANCLREGAAVIRGAVEKASGSD